MAGRRGQPWGEGTANFQVLLQWNASQVYTKTVAYFAQQLDASWRRGLCPLALIDHRQQQGVRDEIHERHGDLVAEPGTTTRSPRIKPS